MKCYFAVSAMVCSLILGCKPRERSYVGYVNKSGHDISDLRLYVQEKEVGGCGVLVSNGNKTEGPWARVPAEAELRWKDSQQHAFTVNLQDTVPKGFTGGTIYFVIGTNSTVKVKIAKLADIDANVAITK
jgi:hypothetical protein